MAVDSRKPKFRIYDVIDFHIYIYYQPKWLVRLKVLHVDVKLNSREQYVSIELQPLDILCKIKKKIIYIYFSISVLCVCGCGVVCVWKDKCCLKKDVFL